MNTSSGVTYLNTKSSFKVKLDDSALEIIEHLSNTASNECLAMLKSMFDGIDDSLFELANNARTNNEQSRYFEAMREVRIKRRGIENDYIQKLNTLFEPDSLFYSKTDKAPSASEHYTIIEREDQNIDFLEQEVAVNAMANKALNQFKDPLLHLTTRLANLGHLKHSDQVTNPLDPQTICQLFAETCAPLEIAIQERLIILKQFDRYIISNYGIILNAVNKVLIRYGILPGLKAPGIRPNTESSDSIYVQESSSSTQQIKEDSAQQNLESLLNQVRLAQQKSAVKTTENSAEHKNSSTQLLALIAYLQKRYARDLENNKVPNNAINIKQVISEEILKSDHPNLGESEEDLINLVSMLFEFIVDDYNLAPSLHTLIGCLQIPILRVVLKDRSFFNNSKHPARQLLNSLARSGIAWSETQDASQDALYKNMHKVVVKALRQFSDDISLFTRLNYEFNQFIALEARHADINESRTKEAEHGRVKSKQAQQKVEQILSHKVLNAHYPIPDEIIEVLKVHWSRVMFMAYLKDEHEHQWHNKVKVVDDLIWCLQPMTDQLDRQKWIKIVPKLLKEIKSGLESISSPSEQKEETTSLVREILTTNFKEESLTAKSPLTRAPKTIAQDKAPHAPKATDKQSNKESNTSQQEDLQAELTQIQQLTPGDWLEFTLGNGNKLRCKLSTRISDIDCLIFVNRMGQKSLEKTSTELAKDLKEKRVIILQKGQIIDRAMSSVLSNLRRK